MEKKNNLKKYWIMIAGVCIICLSLLAIGWIWSNVVRFEKLRQAEHENFSMHITKTAEDFITNKEYGYFSDIIQLLSKINFIRFLSVQIDGKEVRKAGDRFGLDDIWLDKTSPGSQPSFFDVENRDLYVSQKLNYQDKPTNIKMVFSLKEYEKPKQSIVQAFVLIIILLFILSGLGFHLFRIHRKLEISEKTKKDMIYGITHDAKQDLFIIDGKLDAILKEIKPQRDMPTLEKDLRSAREGAQFIDRFLNNLNDHEKMSCGEIQYIIEDVDLVMSLNSVMHSVKEAMATRNMLFGFSHKPDRCLVRADEQLLKRVLKNILHNAMKFSSLGSSIEISIAVVEGVAKVCIGDEGPGIPKQDWEKIFKPYVKLQSKKEGMGLGMATSRKLIETMHGALYVEKSVIGQGTTFAFSLPLAKSE